MTRVRRVGLAALAASATLLLSSCGKVEQPQNVLGPEGPIAKQLDDLWNPVFAIATVIFVLVELLVVYVAIRYRRRSDGDSPKQIHGSTKLELGWTITPALILLFVGALTLVQIGKLDAVPTGDNVLQVKVTGHQWWWEFEYTDGQGKGIVTANEMHIPAEARVDVRVTATDVIHSFWPPKLAGKIDAVPGRINHMEIDTRGVTPGTFYGQCAEYCGLSHANMRLKVIVDTPEDYARWVEGQNSAPGLAFGDDSAEQSGRDLFKVKGCGGCHQIDGYTAGKVGPDLTHFMSRKTFAGSIFPNTTEELRAWLRDPTKMKPMDPNRGMGMPNLNLTEDEISDLIAFLQTLK